MTHIWFNLMVIHAGHMMYIDSFSTYEECHAAQIIYEEKFPEDKFFCPFVRVELT